VLILLNPYANHGRAHHRWLEVRDALEAGERPFVATTTRRAPTAEDVVRWHAEGHRVLVAAGGDGTANALINAIMDPQTDQPRVDVAVGAIGLGSSNDFHKPLDPEHMLAGYPARIDAERAHRVDLGKVTLHGPEARTHWFAINASFGVTALGNHLFNHPGPLLARVKPRSFDLAMALTVAQAVARFRPVPLTLRIEAPEPEEITIAATNLGILKNVHFTGSLRYDTPVCPDDRHFDVNAYADLRLPGMVRALFHLARGRFLGTAGAHHWRATRLEVEAPRPVPLEADGEVFLVERARFEVVARCLRLCS
jgi:diacylglycerol kinase family enzyme